MDQLTSDLSRISIDKSSTRNEQVLQQLRKWLSDNPNVNTILSSARQAKASADDIATLFMATFTYYEKALPQDFGHDPSNYNPQSEMSLIALQRMMKTCESHPVWLLLLDTSSSTAALHPSVEEAESARLRSAHLLLPPWSYFGFDLLDRSMVLPNPNDALRLTNLKWYGRPASILFLVLVPLRS
ncbi:hypothetical protein PC9H_008792 [Pleurotus ostreatus]|uniref:Uncharacterized protein n=2 Tax=Pleurotus TaxID=5320 RepID=A0A8H6ZRZ3_PLEOS|nr:uncharacterized protein PC9H_008792 [Pleurotus ostreatus]KAF7426424.1 hypothetical protein PC9H_008792 [Pleurotus ostreatus]KAG9221833.1 hypothetical protein CCMSSC00406_0005658 [Pleurotus cornucopiae]KAJ8693964.1 hypothetical protein PTI98_008900 [Pleurotus ostreatus]